MQIDLVTSTLIVVAPAMLLYATNVRLLQIGVGHRRRKRGVEITLTIFFR
jgi:hypothetical protein